MSSIFDDERPQGSMSQMRLAEALIDRANVQKHIEQLQERLRNVSLVQQGDVPAEDPDELLGALRAAYGQLEGLIQSINRTNARTDVGGGETLTDLLAKREMLVKRHAFYHQLASEATPKRERYGAGSVRFQPGVSVANLRKDADSLAAEVRRLEIRVQELNWKTELA